MITIVKHSLQNTHLKKSRLSDYVLRLISLKIDGVGGEEFNYLIYI